MDASLEFAKTKTIKISAKIKPIKISLDKNQATMYNMNIKRLRSKRLPSNWVKK